MPQSIPAVLVGDNVDVEFDESIYSLDVIQRAALKFSGLAAIAISRKEPGKLRAQINPFADAEIQAADLERLLVNEVLDQALRERVSLETAAERNLILAHAFSRSRLVNT